VSNQIALYFNFAETRSNLSIGSLVAFYDTEMFLTNNPFCSLGINATFYLEAAQINAGLTVDPGSLSISADSLTGLNTYTAIIQKLLV
jgi:hypothetical protein